MNLNKVYLWVVLLVSVVSAAAASVPSDRDNLATQTAPSASNTVAKTPKQSVSAPVTVHEKIDNSSHAADSQTKIDWVTRVIAIAGVVLSILNLTLSVWKLRRDRRLSVEDDFWFRKIVSPATIEPMIKAVSGLLDKTPAANASSETLAKFAPEVTTEFAKIYASMLTLGLYESSLPTLVNEKLRVCEDLLTEYLGALANTTEGGEHLSILELRERCLIEVNKALEVIKNRHLKR